MNGLLNRWNNCDAIAIGDQGLDFQFPSTLNMFINVLFGKKRLLILKAEGNKNDIIKELKNFCNEKKLDFYKLDSKQLDVDDIRGEIEIIYKEGRPYSKRKKPYYVSGNNQMILIDDLGQETNIETLRAFMYMGSLGSYYDDIENLPNDKLPYGSAYVFIADAEFPLKRFASISSYWHEEAAVLDLRNFQIKVKEHLGEYKRHVLDIYEDGEYNYKGKVIPYKHILPEAKKELNINKKYRTDFFASDYYKHMTLHKYFHHLNSSQAMCINFFYPLIKENLLESILNIIGVEGELNYNPDNICFEKVSELEEHAKRKTNFDFYIKLNSGIEIYFEIKYIENEFGKAEHDNGHKEYKDKYKLKFHETYMPLLKNNPAIKEDFKTEKIFLDNYQIMRNITHIAKDRYVIFIYPKENKGIRKQALTTKNEIIKNDWKNHFILFTWEDIIEQFKYNLNSNELIDYYIKDFSYKYFKY